MNFPATEPNDINEVRLMTWPERYCAVVDGNLQEKKYKAVVGIHGSHSDTQVSTLKKGDNTIDDSEF